MENVDVLLQPAGQVMSLVSPDLAKRNPLDLADGRRHRTTLIGVNRPPLEAGVI